METERKPMKTTTFDPAALDAAIAGIPRDLTETDGRTTNLRHRQYEYIVAHVVPVMRKCRICGSACDRRQDAHNLCVERRKRGLPTPALETPVQCACHACTR